MESVIRQHYSNTEYIVIDGKSSDGSVEMIKQYSDKLSYWVSEKDNGIYHAMNKGIKAATGEYCLFLNSGDCLIDDGILKAVSNELHDDGIIYGNGKRGLNGDEVVVEMPDKLTLDYLSSNSLFHPSSFIQRKLFDTYGLYNESNKIVSDWEFFLKTIIVNNVTKRKIPFEVTLVEDGGVSRDIANAQLIKEEATRALNHYFPQSVLSLIDDYQTLKNSKKTVMSKRFEKVIHIDKFRFARKTVTLLINIWIFLLPKSTKKNGIKVIKLQANDKTN